MHANVCVWIRCVFVCACMYVCVHMCVCVCVRESVWACVDVGVRGWSKLAYFFYMPHILCTGAEQPRY